MLNRRNFISTGIASLLSVSLSTSLGLASVRNGAKALNKRPNSSIDFQLPKSLKEGSKVAITAPASGSAEWSIRGAIGFFKSMGCEVELGSLINNKKSPYKYLSGSDEERAEEFMNYIERSDISAIVCARGGYGSMRILPYLNYDIIANNPKIIIGYSDITALLIAIHNKCGLVTYHGPVASSEFNEFSNKYLRLALFDQSEEVITYQDKKLIPIVGGKAKGKLVGGNLTMIVNTLGTPYEIDTKESIIFIEEVSEEPYKIDRMLSHLWLAGKLQSARGFVLGQFEGMHRKKHFYPGPSFTLYEVLRDRFEKLGKPTLLGLPFGHLKDKITLPLGVSAILDADNNRFQIIGKTVEPT